MPARQGTSTAKALWYTGPMGNQPASGSVQVGTSRAVGQPAPERPIGRRSRRGVAVLALAAVTACSSSTSSTGVVATTTATTGAATSAPATTTPPAATEGAVAGTVQATEPAPTTPAQGGKVTVGLDSEPETLDPAANSLSLANGSIYGAVYEGLMSRRPGEDVQYRLAESLTESADRLSWTLAVRRGVTFHDGTPFDAAAVKFNLERQKASLYNGSSLLPVTSIEVVDDHTVTIGLSEPWTALPDALAGVVGVMVSPTAAADADAFKRNPVGTGPYRLTDWTPGDQVDLVRYDGYWGDPAPLDELVFKFIQVEAARVGAFEAGELDAFTSIVDVTADEARAAGSQVVNPPPTAYGYSYLNLTRPPLDDVRVRRALQLAVDRDAITEAYQGQGFADASFSPFSKDSEWWAAPESIPTFDPDGARALLADYGQPVEITYKLLAGNQEIEDFVRASLGYWEEVGVQVELIIVPDLGTYIGDLLSGNYDVLGFLGGSTGDPDAVTYNLFHTNGSLNYGRYSNPQVDAALETGRRSQDDAERKAAYAAVQQQLRADLPVLITSHGSLYVIAKPGIGGLTASYFFPSRTVSR